MKMFFRLATVAALLISAQANAGTLIGTFLDDTAWSLIHAGSTPSSPLPASDHLRWDPNQTIEFDLTGTTLSATGPQVYSLMSNAGDTATFTLVSFSADLDNAVGFVSGALDYELVVDTGPLTGSYSGTFSFGTMSAAGFPFNSSSISGGVFEIYLWGGDDVNDLGIDIGISAPVPLPAPVLLLLASLSGLALFRRR